MTKADTDDPQGRRQAKGKAKGKAKANAGVTQLYAGEPKPAICEF